MFTESTDAKAGVSVLGPPDAESRLAGRDPDAGKDRHREETGRQRWAGGITDSMDVSLSQLRETVEGRGAWGRRVDTTETLNNVNRISHVCTSLSSLSGNDASEIHSQRCVDRNLLLCITKQRSIPKCESVWAILGFGSYK